MRRSSWCQASSEHFQLVGFAGHFEAILFGNINLSTHPKRHTDELYSWFRIIVIYLHDIYSKGFQYFSLCGNCFISRRKPQSSSIYIEKLMKTNAGMNGSLPIRYFFFLYVFFIKYEVQSNDGKNISSEVQNINGESQFMKLNS